MPRKALFLLIFLSPLYAEAEGVQHALNWQGLFTLGVVILTFVGLISEYKPPHMTMFFSSSVLLLSGVLSPKLFLQGFSNDILLTIAMLCILVRTLEVNGLLEVVGRKILSRSKSYFKKMLSLIIPVASSSAFLNNIPIVLLMTPIVRKWSVNNKVAPSKFLLPLSYAAVLGGACTLIGTSTNLVIYGLLRQENVNLSFFELGLVGLPCCFVGLIYLLLVSKKSLPEREDPLQMMQEKSREFSVEFRIEPSCVLANKSILGVSGRYFQKEQLIQIERNGVIHDAPGGDFILFAGDRLIFLADMHKIAELHAIKGLLSVVDPQFKLDVSSSHFAEVVIPNTSFFIGKTLKQLNFRKTYNASALAIYREGWRIFGDVPEIVLQAGDVLMLLSGEPLSQKKLSSNDFYFIRHLEKLHVFHPLKSLFVLLCTGAMIVAATLGIPIFMASIACVLTLMLTRCISLEEASKSIVWTLLLLIACSFAIGRAMETTGVAAFFASFLLKAVGSNPHLLISGQNLGINKEAITHIKRSSGMPILIKSLNR